VTTIPVDCLRCGKRHHLLRTHHSTMDEGECPRCGYLGWAPVPERTTLQGRARTAGEPLPRVIGPRTRLA
jgi:predicted  nucleic acid-binding Zn-ribbon protein